MIVRTHVSLVILETRCGPESGALNADQGLAKRCSIQTYDVASDLDD